MNVEFVASIAPIVRDADAARSFYRDALGLSFEGEEGDYAFTHKLEGTKHFGLWPLSEAANACFGTAEWPGDISIPQASIEFEVSDVSAAAANRLDTLDATLERTFVVRALDGVRANEGPFASQIRCVTSTHTAGSDVSAASTAVMALRIRAQRPPFGCGQPVENEAAVLMLRGIPGAVEVVGGIVAHTEATHHRLGPFVSGVRMGDDLGQADMIEREVKNRCRAFGRISVVVSPSAQNKTLRVQNRRLHRSTATVQRQPA